MAQELSTDGDAPSALELEGRYRPGLVAQVQDRLSQLDLSRRATVYFMRALREPSRSVRSTAKSMSGSYPSRKMGAGIGFESRTIEYPMILTLEHDPDVLAYVDQPPEIKIVHKARGRTRGFMQTPDFLVLRQNEVVLIECKRLGQILARREVDPDFFVEERGRWTCPPAQAAAEALGFKHEVWTERDFNKIRLRNLELLQDYLLRSAVTAITNYEKARDKIAAALKHRSRLSVDEVLKELAEDVTIDHIYMAMARGDVASDLDREIVADHPTCFLYRDVHAVQAYTSAAQVHRADSGASPATALLMAPGSQFTWDGSPWVICNLGESTVWLQSSTGLLPLPRAEFQRLAMSGELMPTGPSAGSSPEDATVQQLLEAATPSELRHAVERHQRILPFLEGSTTSKRTRTDRRDLARYRQAMAAHGNGFVGLLPGFSRSGNRLPRLAPAVLQIVEERTKVDYQTPTNMCIKHVHGLIVDDCEKQGLPPPSYAWFCKKVANLPAFQNALRRKGARAAYKLEVRVALQADSHVYVTIRLWEAAHIDHTEIDVELIAGEDSFPLGRAWLTVLIDKGTLSVLGRYLTFDPPSYRSVLMTLRDCVQRHGRLPDEIVVDGGKEFQSVWFEVFCKIYAITITRRPPVKPRFGSQIERLFGTLNTNFFHALRGNTQLRKNVRQMTDEVDPDTHAVWTLPALQQKLDHYLFEVYDTLIGRGLQQSPRAARLKSLAQHGLRPHRLIPYDQNFLINSCPSTAKGEAKVQVDGVKINYVYYNSPALQSRLGDSVPVRYEPMNANLAYAQINGRWEVLRTRHAAVLSNRTEREIALACAEWRRRRSSVEKIRLSDKALVQFLQEIQQTESLLLERRRANEMRRSQGMEVDEDDPPATAGTGQALHAQPPSPPANEAVDSPLQSPAPAFQFIALPTY